ncbi:MAG: HAD-IA family hydrolase [bacterium]
MNIYKAVLFDLNGVLILDKAGYVPAPQEHVIFKRLGLSLEDSKEKERIKSELGWTEEEFWKFVDTSWNGAVPNLRLINLIKNLRERGYKTAIISNTSGLIMRQVLQNYFGQDLNTLFDFITISSEVGYLKPGREIYELTIEKLGVQPNEAVMIDDSEDYLTGAKSLGITPILFISNEKLEEDLRRLEIM